MLQLNLSRLCSFFCFIKDEWKQDDKHLPTSEVTCDGTNQDEGKVSTSKVKSDDDGQDERHVSVPEVTSVNVKEDDGQMSASWVTGTDVDDVDSELTPDPAKPGCIQTSSLGITCTDNRDVASATANTARPITINTGEATSRDIEDKSMKRLSQKSGRKRWADLKKRRRSYFVGNKMSIGNVVGKGLFSKQSTEGTNCRKFNKHLKSYFKLVVMLKTLVYCLQISVAGILVFLHKPKTKWSNNSYGLSTKQHTGCRLCCSSDGCVISWQNIGNK